MNSTIRDQLLMNFPDFQIEKIKYLQQLIETVHLKETQDEIDEFLENSKATFNFEQKQVILILLLGIESSLRTYKQLDFSLNQLNVIKIFNQKINHIEHKIQLDIVKKIKIQYLKQNHILFDEGDRAQQLFIILSGKALVIQSQKLKAYSTFINKWNPCHKQYLKFRERLIQKVKDKQFTNEEYNDIISRVEISNLQDSIKNFIYENKQDEETMQAIFILQKMLKMKLTKFKNQNQQIGFKSLIDKVYFRKYTIYSTQQLILGQICFDDYNSIMYATNKHMGKRVAQALMKNPMYQSLENILKESIAVNSKVKTLKLNEMIQPQDQQFKYAYLVIEGQVLASHRNQKVQNLEQNQMFGEEILLGEKSRYDYTCSIPGKVIELDLKRFLNRNVFTNQEVEQIKDLLIFNFKSKNKKKRKIKKQQQHDLNLNQTQKIIQAIEKKKTQNFIDTKITCQSTKDLRFQNSQINQIKYISNINNTNEKVQKGINLSNKITYKGFKLETLDFGSSNFDRVSLVRQRYTQSQHTKPQQQQILTSSMQKQPQVDSILDTQQDSSQPKSFHMLQKYFKNTVLLDIQKQSKVNQSILSQVKMKTTFSNIFKKRPFQSQITEKSKSNHISQNMIKKKEKPKDTDLSFYQLKQKFNEKLYNKPPQMEQAYINYQDMFQQINPLIQRRIQKE